MGKRLTKSIVCTCEDLTKITGKVFSVPVNQLVAILPVAGNAFFTAIPRQIMRRLLRAKYSENSLSFDSCCMLVFSSLQLSSIELRSRMKLIEQGRAGVSILTSQQEKPPVKKLPIFSEFIKNSAKFIKNSSLTKWTQNLRQEDQNRFQGPRVHCLKIEATHQINVFISVFCCIGDHIWQKHCLSFINT